MAKCGWTQVRRCRIRSTLAACLGCWCGSDGDRVRCQAREIRPPAPKCALSRYRPIHARGHMQRNRAGSCDASLVHSIDSRELTPAKPEGELLVCRALQCCLARGVRSINHCRARAPRRGPNSCTPMPAMPKRLSVMAQSVVASDTASFDGDMRNEDPPWCGWYTSNTRHSNWDAPSTTQVLRLSVSPGTMKPPSTVQRNAIAPL